MHGLFYFSRMTKSTLLHLRIPFSLFLSPVFTMAVALSDQMMSSEKLIFSFVAIHLFLYPASNGYNSYFDKDEDSIGGLKRPPKVTTDLYWSSLAFDGIALSIAFMIGIPFGVGLLIYGIISKAYSHPSFRLKKRPWLSWLVVAFFQGGWMFFL